MDERILEVLEFDKMIAELVEQSASSLGKSKSQRLKPSADFDQVVRWQQETDEAHHILRLKERVPLGGIFDIRASIQRAVIGGMLNANECLEIASTIYGGKQLKHFIEKLEEIDAPIITSFANEIVPLNELEREIKSCIDDDGNIMDAASETLRSLRAKIRTSENRVRDRLEEMTKTKSNMLSDAIVTIRNDRYVLPVKQEYRGSIGGIVHDQSSSGQTLFMEPQSVVEVNNNLQAARVEEKQEIERILRVLTERIASDEMFLRQNVNALAEMDFIFARAKLAQGMRASRPSMNQDGYIKMEQARHPLIPADEVVPNDVELGGDFAAIVITGPNTGGKTVALKMVGLCTLMAQSGLQVPALDGCELAVFSNVFADIGDEQSIEQSLSTFSSHMTNIVDIMESFDHQSLLLFDELGAGTDPQEGAALAMSIIDHVMDVGARVIATTHYPELKAYGYNRAGVSNASVEFDIDSLKPTYRLLIGVPGRSNAFEISQRLGLQEKITEQAKEHMDTDSSNVENMIASLEDSRRKAEQDYEEAERVLTEAEELRNDLRKKWKQFEDQREKLYQKAEEKAEKAITNARDEAEAIVSELRNMKEQADWKEHEWIEARKKLQDAQPDLTKKEDHSQSQSSTVDTEQAKPLQSGDEVKLLTLDQKGTVIDQTGKDEFEIQVGIMKMKAKRKDLLFLRREEPVIEKPLATVRGSQYHVKPELDVRGERYEDALQQLEKYIDDALLAGYSKVSIIHGKGTGALRKGVKQFARKHSKIREARDGGMNEGGLGVTVLELS
ncbi:DNA mismatch repair protein MutS [Gracilibacillus halophilus YIM-C55.5]|uniref:Endonuclease MutS2 n=1 Tax=Gracilibacillus halophilus YIM-C55.5 TaxID=1308866 RepID=N4WRM3_9BACI|nr:endonuclease MutS2 [Gracilibacillus halophilus]ENH97035.1 DNA mismatch repair protein MutS [Gracilibacillus halophilus YIM-C55.5]